MAVVVEATVVLKFAESASKLRKSDTPSALQVRLCAHSSAGENEMIVIGPRQINYIDSSGDTGVIDITVKLFDPRKGDIGNGESMKEYHGEMTLDCKLFTRTFKKFGFDHLHLLMLFMWFSDIWLRRVCRENGISIYKVQEGDIVDDFSVYKP